MKYTRGTVASSNVSVCLSTNCNHLESIIIFPHAQDTRKKCTSIELIHSFQVFLHFINSDAWQKLQFSRNTFNTTSHNRIKCFTNLCNTISTLTQKLTAYKTTKRFDILTMSHISCYCGNNFTLAFR